MKHLKYKLNICVLCFLSGPKSWYSIWLPFKITKKKVPTPRKDAPPISVLSSCLDLNICLFETSPPPFWVAFPLVNLEHPKPTGVLFSSDTPCCVFFLGCLSHRAAFRGSARWSWWKPRSAGSSSKMRRRTPTSWFSWANRGPGRPGRPVALLVCQAPPLFCGL